MKQNLRDYPTLKTWSDAGLDMRCFCGAPLNLEQECIISGVMERYCMAWHEPSRDGEGDRFNRCSESAWFYSEVEHIQQAVRKARRSYFAALAIDGVTP